MKNIQSLHYKKIWVLLFVVVVVLSFFLKIYKLGQIPVSLYWDETAMVVDAKSIAQTGKDMHGNSWLQAMFPSYGDYKLPVYIWLASISVRIFGVSEFSLRLVSVLFGTAQMLVLMILGQKLLSRIKLEKSEKYVFSLSILIITTITPWIFHFSRVSFEGFVGQFFVTLSMLCLLFTDKRKWMWMLVVITGALAVYSYYSVRFVWPVLLLISIFLPTSKKITQQSWVSKISFVIWPLLAGILWLACLIPLFTSPHYQASQTFRLSTPSILNEEKFIIQSNQLREVAGNGVISRVVYHRNVLKLRAVLQQYAEHLNPTFLFLQGDQNLRHGTGTAGLLLLASSPFLVIGIFYLWQRERRVLFFLVIWWMIGILPAAIPLSSPHALRSLNSLSPLLLFTSIGLFLTILKLSMIKLQKVEWWVSLFLVLFLGVNSVSFFHDYFSHYNLRSASQWQAGYKKLALYIDQYRHEVQTVWVDIGDDRFYLWLLAYGTFDAQQIQQLPFEKYQLKRIENIHFSGFDWNQSASVENTMLVVEKPGNLLISPDEKHQIKDKNGVTQFEVGIYGK